MLYVLFISLILLSILMIYYLLNKVKKCYLIKVNNKKYIG